MKLDDPEVVLMAFGGSQCDEMLDLLIRYQNMLRRHYV